MSDRDQTSTDEPYYAFRPSLLGDAWEFRLGPQALEWARGSRNGRIPYAEITRVRLSFRPVTMQSHRFITEIWSRNGPKLQITSTSWKSMVEQQRLDADYSAFVTALHRRMAAAGSRAAFVTGYAAPLYWIGLAVFAVTAFALAGLTVRAVQFGAWAGGTFTAVFFAIFLWQVGNFFRRNRPIVYRPEAPPAVLLPGG
jgi:hypothetical protein